MTTGSRVRRRFVLTTAATNLLLLLCNINQSYAASTNRIHTRRRIVANVTQSAAVDNTNTTTTTTKTITPGPFYAIKMNATDETYYAEMGDTEDQLKHTPDIVPCVIQERKVDPITKKKQKPSLYCEKDENYLLLSIHENTNENDILYTDAYGHIRKSRLDNSPVINLKNNTTTKTAPEGSKHQQQPTSDANVNDDDDAAKSHIYLWYLCFTLVISLAFVALFFVYCTCCCCEKEHDDDDNKPPYYEKDTDFSEVDFVDGHKRFYDNIDYEDDDNVTVASAEDLQEVDLGR